MLILYIDLGASVLLIRDITSFSDSKTVAPHLTIEFAIRGEYINATFKGVARLSSVKEIFYCK